VCSSFDDGLFRLDLGVLLCGHVLPVVWRFGWTISCVQTTASGRFSINSCVGAACVHEHGVRMMVYIFHLHNSGPLKTTVDIASL
jgi:hypothetical protein